MKSLKECIDQIQNEAVSGQSVEKIVQKYASQAKKPEAYSDLMKQALSVLGPKSSVGEQDLEMSLRKFAAQKYGRSPTTMQKVKQAVSSPLSLFKKKSQQINAPSKMDPSSFKAAGVPSLSSLAQQSTSTSVPKPKSSGDLPDLPDVEPQDKEKAFTGFHGPEFKTPGIDDTEDEKTTSSSPSDKDEPKKSEPSKDEKEKSVQEPKKDEPKSEPKEKDSEKDKESDDSPELDMKNLGTVKKPASSKKTKPKTAKSEPSSMPSLSTVAKGEDEKEKQQNEPSKDAEKMPSLSTVAKPATTSGKKPPPIDLPAFYRAGMKSQKGESQWKVGDTVDLGLAGKAKVIDKVGNRWYLEASTGHRYVFIPYKGLHQIKDS